MKMVKNIKNINNHYLNANEGMSLRSSPVRLLIIFEEPTKVFVTGKLPYINRV